MARLIGNRNWEADAALGLIDGVSVIHKFGSNPVVGTGDEAVWSAGGLYNWLTTAATLEAISTDANDTAAGSATRTIRLEGIDSTWAAVTEDLTMAGISATSATSASFIRLNRAYQLTNGAYTARNDGDITIRVSSAGATVGFIATDSGQTEQALYSVPDGKIALVTNFSIVVESNKAVHGHFFFRPGADTVAAPFIGARQIHHISGLTGQYVRPFDSYQQYVARTDLWWEAHTSTGSSEIDIDFDILLFDA